VQTPPLQASFVVQVLPSSHAVPLAFGGLEQRPVDDEHVPTRWQLSIAVQTTSGFTVQTPDRQVSLCVQRFPWPHQVPSGLIGFEHEPVDGSQSPTS
jgi:hypothetical protein